MAKKDQKAITLTENTIVDGDHCVRGEVMDVNKKDAELLVGMKKAVLGDQAEKYKPKKRASTKKASEAAGAGSGAGSAGSGNE